MQYPVQTLVGNLLLLAKHVAIVHHVPGRIRLRLSPSILTIAGDMDLSELMNAIPGVTKTRIKMIVGSVVIEYDRNLLSPDLWESLLGCNGDSVAASEIEGRLTDLIKGK